MNEASNNYIKGTKKRKVKTNVLPFMEQGKIPPQAVDIEQAVLGALLLEKNALTAVIDILKPEVFYKEAHQIIFKSIYNLFLRSEPIDILTVTNELKNTGELEKVGGPFYITQLTNRVASAANIEYHTRILYQKYLQREMIRVSSEVIRDAYEDMTDVFDLLDKAESNLFKLSENNFRREYSNMQSLVKEAIKEIQAARDSESNLRGVPSGFTELDRITSGWQKSDLIVLAARPGMGKTAFALSMARNIAVDFKIPVAFFSLEMSSIQLVTRLISSETNLSANKLRKGDLKNYEWEQLNVKIENLIDAPIFIDDTPALSIFELRAKCRRLKEQRKVQLIVVDYIQLMATTGESKINREQEISNISRSLKSLAKELNIPIIVISQLNRSVELRGGIKRPILSDLRESGAIEQDADMVIFIYRPEYYDIDEDEKGNSTAGIAEIIIAKHRNGPQANIQLRFISKFAKFVDLEPSEFDKTGFIQNDVFDKKQPNTYTIPSKMNDMKEDKDTPF